MDCGKTSMLGLHEYIFKGFEVLALSDKVKVCLQRLIFLHLVEIIMQTLQVLTKAVDEVFDCMFSLVDAIQFFFRVFLSVVLGLIGVRNDFNPYVQDSNGESDGEVQHKDCRSKFDHAEILEIEEEHVLSLALLLSCLGFLLGGDLSGVLFQIKFEDVVDVHLFSHCHIPFSLNQRILTILGKHFSRARL